MNKISPAWRYYAGLYKSVLGRLAFSVLLLVSQSFLYLPVVFLVRYAFNTALPNHDWQGLAVNTLGAIACLLVISIIGMWARRQALQVGRTVVEQFRFDLFQRLNNFSRRRYTKLDLQHYRFSMISETDRLESMNFAILTQMLPGILGGMMLGFILIYINWKLVTVFIATLPILMGIGQLIRTRIAASHDRYIKALRNLAVEVNLMASLLDLIHVQSAEQDELDARKISISNLGGASQSLWSMRMFYNEFQNLTLIMIALLIFLVGSRAVIQGDLLASDLAIFYLVLGLLLSVLRPVWGAYPQLVTGNLSLNHLHDLLTDSDEPPYTGQRRLSFSGHIRLERVSFGYETQAVLSEFNLDIAPSEIIALSGANGIGKTTLIHLLLGFYRPWQGQLFADGIPYSDLDITSLRAQMGIVTQNTLLWPGSLWDNLTYGNQSIPRSVALEACHLACVDEFVAQLPHGYETTLGELGVLLSGGQRQRVAIARALMRKPKLLVLDEPTNHLDKQTAQKILETISNLPYAPAVLFVTHDSSVIKYAQRVVEFRSPNVPVAESDYE